MKNFFVLLFCFFLKKEMTAQDVFLEQYVKIETTDGHVIYGRVLENEPTYLLLLTGAFRAQSVLKIDIKTIELGKKPSGFDPIDSTQIAVDNTRYIMISSSEGLARGEGRFQNISFVFSRVEYGFTDHFSCAVGTVIFPEFVGFYAMPKWSFPQPNGRGSTSFSVLAFKYLDIYDSYYSETGTFIGYLDHTVKWQNGQITFGLGYGKAKGYWVEKPVPTISGLIKFSKKWYGVSESWMFYGDSKYPIVVSGMAIRRVGRHVGWDFGAANAYSKGNSGQSPALPFVGINVKFGKKK